MNLAIFWKEIREQFGILMALSVMGTGIIVSAATLGTLTADHSPFDLYGYAEPARLASIVLVAVSGLVIGSMLFAGEHENGTADFFLHLPTSRSRLWIGKMIAGLVLAFFMSLVFWVASASVGMFAIKQMVGWWIWMIVLGLSAYSAGAFGSSLAKQVLPACGIGIATGPIVSGIALLTVSLLYQYSLSQQSDLHRTSHVFEYILAAAPMASMVLFVLLSYLFFTRPDRLRRQNILSEGAVKTAIHGIQTASRRSSSMFGIRALFWFVRRTWLIYAIVMFTIALISGLLLFVPDVPVVFVWPMIALVLGTLAGVFCFIGEQVNGVNRFWAERSLPAGRLWFAKVCVGLGVLFWCLVISLIPILIMTISQGRRVQEMDGVVGFMMQMFRTRLLMPGFPYSIGLLLWPVYGFVAGLLSGMCFQKPLVSFAVGLMTGAMVAVMWVPSLLSGGLMGWQVWPAPLMVLLLSRLLVRDWAVGRIAKGRGLFKLVLAIVLPLLLIAGGIAYRAIEVPICQEMDDDIIFSKKLPTLDDQQPGRVLKRAIGQFNSQHEPVQTSKVEGSFSNTNFGQNSINNSFQLSQYLERQTAYCIRNGYPTDQPEFDKYLDRHFNSTDWVQEWKKILGRPPGVFVDPNETTTMTWSSDVEQFMRMASVLEVRCLQEQARGNPDVAVEYFDLLLTAVRTLRHQTTLTSFFYASSVETLIVQTIDRWLERLDHNPVLLRKLLAVLQTHDLSPTENPKDMILANQVMTRNLFNNVEKGYAGNAVNSTVKEKLEQEARILQFCWNVPWEKERLHRVIGLCNATYPPPGISDQIVAFVKSKIKKGTQLTASEPSAYLAGSPMSSMLDMSRKISPYNITSREMYRVARTRGMMIVVALRLYEAEKGQLPETLDELVPLYLPSIPLDPYTGNKLPFRFERSLGRTVYLKSRALEERVYPGWNDYVKLKRPQLQAMVALAGGLSGVPLELVPWTLPTNDPEIEINMDSMQAVMALTGALPAAVHDCPPFYQEFSGEEIEVMGGGSPGMATAAGSVFLPDFYSSSIQPIVVAGIGGACSASIIWDDVTITRFSNSYEHAITTMEPQFVPKGRGIVWSIGQNGFDDGGFINDTTNGDMIFLVPPAVKWQPITRGPNK